MTAFTIHATKDGESMETVMTGPTMSVAKARALLNSGWQVHITDSDGRVFQPEKFDRFCHLTTYRHQSSSRKRGRI